MSSFTTVYTVELEGAAPIMFDPYYGSNAKENANRPNRQRFYADPETGAIALPAKNVRAFFSSQKRGAIYRMMDAKLYQKQEAADWFSAGVFIAPDAIPFLREGKPLVPADLAKFDRDGIEPATGLHIELDKACVVKGTQVIPQEKRRAVLGLPWTLRLEMGFCELPGSHIDPAKVRDWMEKGGLIIALGTYRPVYGRFLVTQFIRKAG